VTPLVYIAGPMTGLPNWNHPAFYAMEECLRQRGITAINPAALNPITRPWWRCLLVCLWHLRLADAIVLLPSWEASRGARWELWLALCLGLPVFVAPTEGEPRVIAPPSSGVVH